MTCCTEADTCSVERVGDTILISCAVCGTRRTLPTQDEQPLVEGGQGRTDQDLALAATAWVILGIIASLGSVAAVALWAVRL